MLEFKKENLKELHFITKNINFPIAIAIYNDWEKIQLKPDFEQFVTGIELLGIEFDKYNILYSASEKVEAYCKWVRKEKIEL